MHTANHVRGIRARSVIVTKRLVQDSCDARASSPKTFRHACVRMDCTRFSGGKRGKTSFSIRNHIRRTDTDATRRDFPGRPRIFEIPAWRRAVCRPTGSDRVVPGACTTKPWNWPDDAIVLHAIAARRRGTRDRAARTERAEWRGAGPTAAFRLNRRCSTSDIWSVSFPRGSRWTHGVVRRAQTNDIDD